MTIQSIWIVATYFLIIIEISLSIPAAEEKLVSNDERTQCSVVTSFAAEIENGTPTIVNATAASQELLELSIDLNNADYSQSAYVPLTFNSFQPESDVTRMKDPADDLGSIDMVQSKCLKDKKI